MTWDSSSQFGPRWVSTLDVAEDIQRLFCPEEDVAMLLATVPQDQRHKLIVLAERLEFIEHLRVLVENLKSQKGTLRITDQRNATDGTVTVTAQEQLFMWDHDFAGVDYDIESLIQYLLLTCIDTIMGDPARMRGYKKIFVSAFTDEFSSELKGRFMDGFAVLRVVNRAVVPAEVALWESQSDDQKIKALAKKLYDIRSRFSHNSIRSFFPVQPVNQIQATEGEVLIRIKKDESLFDCLWDSVVYLSRKILLGLDGDTVS